jgi:hypothetical protein
LIGVAPGGDVPRGVGRFGSRGIMARTGDGAFFRSAARSAQAAAGRLRSAVTPV